MLRRTRNARSAFTLLELLVVVSILAILAALVLPRLDGLQSNANHAVSASAVAETMKSIELYKKSKFVYPDGWDSLSTTDGTALWQASTPSTKGLHQQLSGNTRKFYGATLSTAEINGLNNAGIYTLYNVDANIPSATRPGDAFNTQISNATLPLTTNQVVAFVDGTTTGGAKIIDHIYRDNKIVGHSSGALPNSNTRLLALGLGPHNAMIGKWMVEAPEYANVDRTVTYNRLLAIFELATTGEDESATTKVTLRAVVGTDGDLLDDLTASMNKAVN